MVRYNEFNESIDTQQIKKLVNQYYGFAVNTVSSGDEWRDIKVDIDPDGSIEIISDCQLVNSSNILPPLNIKECQGSFLCDDRKLKSLQYSPKIVRGSFECTHNPIHTLKYGPTEVEENYICSHCDLDSLQYAPTIIHGGFHCAKNNLENLKYAPTTIKGVFDCTRNPLKSLEGLEHTSDIAGPIHLRYSSELPLLRVMIVKKGVYFDEVTPLEALINEFAKSDLTLKEKIYQCQYAMIKAGFKGNAKW